ncbi:PIG-L deacetylase family protein [Thermoactinomyces mirandus]|uniref:PIG-L family deacetylase n=1 Tax=Thermoactinomyces mirandus TaxID=2756294 RepID=A0A7W1XUF8_9BACL|nr:PIG-L family deacetylase [Thermoactinomyces mirandus]MBA4603435.1 PIG-L family deacetylase [Thermoactinomyces mirandus]
MKQHHVMTIGAHALDAELMGGPVAIKYTREGHKATFVHITRGERGNRKKSPEKYGKQLNEEMPKVAEAMGATSHWMGYLAGKLSPKEQMQMDLCKLLRKEKPDIVITHWRGSLHPRHVLTYDVVLEAVRMAANDAIETGQKAHAVEYLYFGENCEDLDGFIPQVYIEIEDTFEQWFAAMSHYESFRANVANVPYQDYYRTMATIRTVEIGTQKLSKAFMVARRAQNYLHF